MKRILLLAAATGLVFCGGYLAFPQQNVGQAVQAQAFVQNFYDWYGARVIGLNHPEPNAIIAIRHRPDDFSSRLRNALEADWAAQKRADEIVGLDFDPLTNSQDPDDHYIVRQVKRRGNLYLASIWGHGSSAPRDHADLIAVVTRVNGKWQFQNFLYPADGKISKFDLLGQLELLRKSRRE